LRCLRQSHPDARQEAGTAAAVAEFFATHSNSPVAERVHFSHRRQDLDGKRMLARPPECRHQDKPRLRLGITPIRTWWVRHTTAGNWPLMGWPSLSASPRPPACRSKLCQLCQPSAHRGVAGQVRPVGHISRSSFRRRWHPNRLRCGLHRYFPSIGREGGPNSERSKTCGFCRSSVVNHDHLARS
jgi:hypothetical protein